MIVHGPSDPAASLGLHPDNNPQPAGFDAVDQRDFRNAMASLAASVCLVTIRQPDAARDPRIGRTVTAMLSLSVEPPTVLVSLKTGSELEEAIQRKGSFSLAILSQDQAHIAAAFAGSKPPETRFSAAEWRDWPSGNPRLSGAVATMDCGVIGVIAASGHRLIAACPSQLSLAAMRLPLLWHGRQYRVPAPLPFPGQAAETPSSTG